MGVLTSWREAGDSLDELKKLHGTTSPNGDPIEYELFYNETKWIGDFIEVFAQRLKEHNKNLNDRFERFWDLSRGKWWERFVNKGLLAKDLALVLQKRQLHFTINSLNLLINNTLSDYTKHNNRIDNHIMEGNKLLFVAHSQGNLFVNHAHTYAQSKLAKLPADPITGKK